MKNNLENNTLTLYLEGEINSTNCDVVDADIDSAINSNKFKNLVLDFTYLRYISSAGLRILIKLRQRFDDISLLNVSDDVYTIFEMVGFTAMFKISKK